MTADSVRAETGPKLRWYDDGTVSIDDGDMGRDYRQPTCATCGEEILWSLDMFSFGTGDYPHKLSHARCVWTKNGFTEQRKQAPSE